MRMPYSLVYLWNIIPCYNTQNEYTFLRLVFQYVMERRINWCVHGYISKDKSIYKWFICIKSFNIKPLKLLHQLFFFLLPPILRDENRETSYVYIMYRHSDPRVWLNEIALCANGIIKRVGWNKVWKGYTFSFNSIKNTLS